MAQHVCPWWGGYFIDNPLRRWLHNPDRILAPLVGPNMRVMDFGCGMGLFTIAAARLVGPGGQVTAVDLQQQMLDVLGKRAARVGLRERVRTHRCEAHSIKLAETFDFALAFYSAHETPDQRHLLGELHACLEPSGRLLVVEPRGHVTAGAFRKMLDQARDAGFRELERPAVRLSHAVLLGIDA